MRKTKTTAPGWQEVVRKWSRKQGGLLLTLWAISPLTPPCLESLSRLRGTQGAGLQRGVRLTLHTRATRGIRSLKTNSYSTDTSVKKKNTRSSPPAVLSGLSRTTSEKTKLGSAGRQPVTQCAKGWGLSSHLSTRAESRWSHSPSLTPYERCAAVAAVNSSPPPPPRSQKVGLREGQARIIHP